MKRTGWVVGCALSALCVLCDANWCVAQSPLTEPTLNGRWITTRVVTEDEDVTASGAMFPGMDCKHDAGYVMCQTPLVRRSNEQLREVCTGSLDPVFSQW